MDGYPHNGYLTDMDTDTDTRQIFIQRIGYGGATTRTLPVPLTSLISHDSVGAMYVIQVPIFIFLTQIESQFCLKLNNVGPIQNWTK